MLSTDPKAFAEEQKGASYRLRLRRAWRDVSNGKPVSVLLVILLLLAAAEFLDRGPVRFLREGQNWNDFLSPYIQSKAWLQGGDPYSTREFINLWPSGAPHLQFVDRDAANGNLQKLRGVPTPYPITTFVVLSPFARFSWKKAELLWIALNTGFALFSLFALPALYGGALTKVRARTFLMLGLALAPIHTGLATANPVILTIGLCVSALLLSKADWPNCSGLLLAFAVCIKPPIGICVLVYFLVQRRWAAVRTMLASVLAVVFVGVAHMYVAGVPWLPSYLKGSHRIFIDGALADFTSADPVRFNMVDLRILIFALFGKAYLVEALSLACGAILAAIWLYMVILSDTDSGLLEFSALSVLSLLPIYHRFYDASLLIWPLYWSLTAVGHRMVRAVTIFLIFPFLFPGAVLLDEAVQRGWIPVSIAHSYWWNALVMPHEVWSLLLLSLLLLYSMRARELPTADQDRGDQATI
jgi:hypothetical protein